MRPPLGANGSLAQLTVSINRSQATVGVAETKTGRTGLARFGNLETRVPLLNRRKIASHSKPLPGLPKSELRVNASITIIYLRFARDLSPSWLYGHGRCGLGI